MKIHSDYEVFNGNLHLYNIPDYEVLSELRDWIDLGYNAIIDYKNHIIQIKGE